MAHVRMRTCTSVGGGLLGGARERNEVMGVAGVARGCGAWWARGGMVDEVVRTAVVGEPPEEEGMGDGGANRSRRVGGFLCCRVRSR